MTMDWLVTDDDPDDLGPAHVAAVDAQDMYGAVEALPDHLEEGWETALRTLGGVPAVPPQQRHNGVVVCGMGGSAIGADVVGAALPSLTLPYQVVRGYVLPAWVTPQTLVVCVSYSGDTAETLSCLEAALARGCRPVCVATGGGVAAIAGQRQFRTPGTGWRLSIQPECRRRWLDLRRYQRHPGQRQ